MLINDEFELPITSPTGKVRVKRRSFFYEYGIPVATRSIPIQQTDYIEWQIGYDLLANKENRSVTKLSNFRFRNSKGELKFPYELSEILYFAYTNNLISDKNISDTYKFVSRIQQRDLLDVNNNMQITRTNPLQTEINGIDFYAMEVRYPLIVNKFGIYDIYTEVMNREKQRGVGNQPMLYLCIPLTSQNLRFVEQPLIGRTAKPNEHIFWKISKNEARLTLLLFKIFGMLSERHQSDVKGIFTVLFPHIIKS